MEGRLLKDDGRIICGILGFLESSAGLLIGETPYVNFAGVNSAETFESSKENEFSACAEKIITWNVMIMHKIKIHFLLCFISGNQYEYKYFKLACFS